MDGVEVFREPGENLVVLAVPIIHASRKIFFIRLFDGFVDVSGDISP